MYLFDRPSTQLFAVVTLAVPAVLFVLVRRYCRAASWEAGTDGSDGVVCAFCGYSRRGLEPNRRCPECGQVPREDWSAPPPELAAGPWLGWWRLTLRIFRQPDEFFRGDALSGRPDPSWAYMRRSHDIGAAAAALLGCGLYLRQGAAFWDWNFTTGVYFWNPAPFPAAWLLAQTFLLSWLLMTVCNRATAWLCRLFIRGGDGASRVLNYHSGIGGLLFAGAISAGFVTRLIYEAGHATTPPLLALNVLAWALVAVLLLFRAARALGQIGPGPT